MLSKKIYQINGFGVIKSHTYTIYHIPYTVQEQDWIWRQQREKQKQKSTSTTAHRSAIYKYKLGSHNKCTASPSHISKLFYRYSAEKFTNDKIQRWKKKKKKEKKVHYTLCLHTGGILSRY